MGKDICALGSSFRTRDEGWKKTNEVGFAIFILFIHHGNWAAMVIGGIQPLDPVDDSGTHDMLETPVHVASEELIALIFEGHAPNEPMVSGT